MPKSHVYSIRFYLKWITIFLIDLVFAFPFFYGKKHTLMCPYARKQKIFQYIAWAEKRGSFRTYVLEKRCLHGRNILENCCTLNFWKCDEGTSKGVIKMHTNDWIRCVAVEFSLYFSVTIKRKLKCVPSSFFSIV